MPLTYSYDAEHLIVTTTLSGNVTPKMLKEEAVQAILLGKENDCNRFLSDCSQAVFNFSSFDVFNLPELHQQQGLNRSARMAVITPAYDKGLELADFFETVSVNRGWISKAFKDRQEAIAWLLD